MADLKSFLEEHYERYNQPGFIELDPISVPHRFTIKQDIEIAAFFAATLAWGQRKTIIKKCLELLDYMDNAPYNFITGHEESDLVPFTNFKHRTFQPTDVLYFLSFFKEYYKNHTTLEDAFAGITVRDKLVNFRKTFFRHEFVPDRTKKHLSSPETNSACKRTNMFLRWMVRKDNKGVDFGIWNTISPSILVCPYDVHVQRVARKLGLVKRTQADWKAAIELTENLKKFDQQDPVKYDFALFGLGMDGAI